MALERAARRGGRADRVDVDAVGGEARLRAGVDDDRDLGGGGARVERIEARIVGAELLDVAVDLEAAQAEAQRLVDDRLGVGLAGQDGAERDQLVRMGAGELGHEAVEVARHLGDVRVAEADDARDAVGAEVRQDVVGVQPVSNLPRMAIEPAPDGVEDARRK